MRARTWAVPGLILLAAAASAENTGTEKIPENVFAVVMTFEQDFSRPTLENMQRELEYILEPFDFQFRWRLGLNDRREEIANLLISVRMRGRCSISLPEEPPKPFPTRVLGQTEMSEGKLLSYCDVDCDGVRNMIWSAVSGESFVQMQNLMGRALGRVLAHDVFHILAGTTRHRRNGISRAVMTPEDLVEGVMQLEPEEVEGIRRHTFPAPVQLRNQVPATGGASAGR